MRGWIGVDFDGTLAEIVNPHMFLEFGPPIPAMVDKVRAAIGAGYEVRIFTARVSDRDPEIDAMVRVAIQDWCFKNVGFRLPVTNLKDYAMLELWDDRAIQVVPNTGEFVGPGSELI